VTSSPRAKAIKKKAPAKRAATPPDAADAGGPRYLQIARALTGAISDGHYPVGARLPTELELCAQFEISRFTAREAVRVLLAAGLITRRQRIGTVVIALPSDARYTHAVASVGDLFQYARDTELRLMFIDRIALTRERAAQFGTEAGEEWVYAMGMRRESALAVAVDGADARGNERSSAKAGAASGRARATKTAKPPRASHGGEDAAGPPICITRLFLSPVLKGIEARLRERKTAVYALIEREFGVQIQRVEQDLQSIALDADDAANLGAVAGAPALRIVRRYYDSRDRLLEVAENIHPGERFTYHMQLRK
jgi:DNA-binding GntR family transcriptional regulator